MNIKICALPSCDNTITDRPFKLGLYPGEYCSRECVNDAYSLKKSGEPFSKVPDEPKDSQGKKEVRPKKVPHIDAADFGNVGVIRHFCDNPSCANPGNNPVMEIDGKLLTVITLCWKGRSGEYCSNECMKTEKEKKMTDEQDDSPVSTGTATAPAKKGKKVAKKGSAKAAKKAEAAPAADKKPTRKEAKKAAGYTNEAGKSSRFANDMTITVKKTDHGLSGNRGLMLDIMKSGMTVEKFKEAAKKKEHGGMAGWALKYATENGLAAVK